MSYKIKQYKDKNFETKMDMISFIKKNKEEMMSIKKAEYKTKAEIEIKSDLVVKKYEGLIEDITGDYMLVKTLINSTNVIDSHLDLHFKETWNKTVKDNPFSTHLQSHNADFNYLISSKAKNYNEEMNFKDLGLNIDMLFNANINEFVLRRKTLPLMFDKYKNGEVNQHSVGMLYVNLELFMADEDDEKAMQDFNEVLKKAINPEIALDYGMVWGVKEAKKREGSAVVFASNSITPTLFVKNYEPQQGTRKDLFIEPSKDTQESIQSFYKKLLN